MAVGNFDLKIPTEIIPSVNPLVFSEFLVVILMMHYYFRLHGSNHLHYYNYLITVKKSIQSEYLIQNKIKLNVHLK